MRVIYKRTLQETLRLSFILMMLAAGILGGLVVGKEVAYDKVPTFDYYLNRSLIMQHMVAFFLVCGAALMIIVCASASGLIAGEVHEGTFRILVAKPNSRMSILLAKVLGMLTGSLILMVLGLSAMFTSEFFFGNFDGPVIKAMLGYFPGYALYGTIVTLFLSSLATLISCLAKKKVIALLPMLLVIALVLIIPIIVRVILMMRNTSFANLGVADPNYHFGSIFKWCMNLCGGINGNSDLLEFPTLLMNIFKQSRIDRDLTRTVDFGVITRDNNVVPAVVLVASYLGLTVFNYITSFAIIRKKDV